MKFSSRPVALFLGLTLSAGAFAQVPAAAPAGSTGACRDGSYTSNAEKRGACAGHRGVKSWFAESAAPAMATPSAPAAKTTAVPAEANLPAPAPRAASPAPATTAAAGGEGAKVWVNTPSKVYHCAGTKFYGKTKQGEYMSEASAKAAGDRPDHGKVCS